MAARRDAAAAATFRSFGDRDATAGADDRVGQMSSERAISRSAAIAQSSSVGTSATRT